MTQDKYTSQDADDDLTLGYRGGKDQTTLRAWSYLKLCSELEDAKHGTTAYMLIEAEKNRRDSIPSEQLTSKPRDKPAPDHWYKKPVPVIVLGVLIGCVLLAIRYVLTTHFKISV